MSQVSFKSTAEHDGRRVNVEVVGGWDPPIGYYHLTIFFVDEEDKEKYGECLFSNLDHVNWMMKHRTIDSINDFTTVLKGYNIDSIPAGFLLRCSYKDENVFYFYKSDTKEWVVNT